MFFAFEAILGLIMINLEYWFNDIFSPLQIVSWILLCCGVAASFAGFNIITATTKKYVPNEHSRAIVKTGIYKYIRHPLHTALICFASGALCKQISIFTTLLFIAAIVFSILSVRAEEDENLAQMGNEYSLYIKTTKKFIPHIY
jgi:protein-S-isoprenylcysteine O-methyltransferase Ste14